MKKGKRNSLIDTIKQINKNIDNIVNDSTLVKDKNFKLKMTIADLTTRINTINHDINIIKQHSILVVNNNDNSKETISVDSNILIQ